MKLASLLSVLAACSLIGCGNEASPDTSVAKLQKIHRGELSAITTYDKAIEKASAPIKTDLTRIRDEHRDAAGKLAARITARGATADATAGPWGDWTNLLTSAAASIDDAALLKVLKTGERHGTDEYQEGLKLATMDSESKTLLQTLLDRQNGHVVSLERLEKVEKTQ